MNGSNRLIPLALFMFAFSMGMDLHHTQVIEGIETARAQPQTDTCIIIKPETRPDSTEPRIIID